MEASVQYSPQYAPQIKVRRPRPQEKGRDPYDGLRPWSAITHGVGAALALLGTVLLLVKTPGSWCPSPSTGPV